MRVTPITTTGEIFSIECSRTELWDILHGAMDRSNYLRRIDCDISADLSSSMASIARTALTESDVAYENFCTELFADASGEVLS
jgi:hypothetical protein